MNRRDWYFRQGLKENEFDAAFADVEAADFNIVKDLKLYGIASGGEVTPTGVGTCDVAAFVGHDKQGRRVFRETTLAVDFTNDSVGDPTVPSSGHFRWITLVARHGYLPSDARTDGNGDAIHFMLTETISETGDDNAASADKLQIIRGNEAGSIGAAVLPSIGADDIIVADLILNDTGAVDGGAAGVSYARVTRVAPFVIQPYNSLNSFGPGDLVFYQGETYSVTTTVPPGIAPSNQTYWILWRRQPTPGSLTAPTTTWMNAKRQPVSGIDHWGFPSGKLVTVDENWLDVGAVPKTATGNGPWFGPWFYYVNNGGGFAGTGISAPGVLDPNTQPWGPTLQMNVFGQSVDAAAAIELRQAVVKMGGASFAMEWAFSLADGGGSGVPLPLTDWAMGISFGGVYSGASPDPIRGGTADYPGCYIYGRGVDATWSWVINNGTASAGGSAGAGIAVNAPHFAKLVIVGANASDDGVARCLLFVDGTLVANQAISMAGQLIVPFFRTHASQGEVMKLSIGPVTMHARTALNNEFGP